jgi:predicted Zn-dependent protease with MMP-like domain
MLDDEQFDALITRAMDELPKEYIENMINVAIVMQDEPTDDQKAQMKLRDGVILLGLFEGTPKTGEGAGLFPSKITLFKHSILRVAHSDDEVFDQIKRTLWHEIAHYYGLSHSDMNKRIH